jgi:Leucine-rich repeat (LRR) protein
MSCSNILNCDGNVNISGSTTYFNVFNNVTDLYVNYNFGTRTAPSILKVVIALSLLLLSWSWLKNTVVS